MITDEQIRLFSQYCSENFGTELKSVRKSERYQSLPICVLDCVYSLRTKYFAVTVPVLQRYADTYMGGNLYAGQDTLSDFITHIKEFSDCSEFAKTVLKNNQVLSGRNKAEVCYEIATKLHELLNMDTFDDFRNFEKEALLEIVLRSVRGMGDAGVNYMFMMAGDPNRCKPDVHIHRCIKNALGTDVPNNECQILFRETVKKLKDSGYPDLTVRNLDSVIWNKYQKNRSIFYMSPVRRPTPPSDALQCEHRQTKEGFPYDRTGFYSGPQRLHVGAGGGHHRRLQLHDRKAEAGSGRGTGLYGAL